MRERDVAAHVHGETGLDGPDLPAPAGAAVAEHAVDFLAREIRARDGRLTLVPTGPLTNVALLLALHPDARPERIVLMGGAVGEGNRTPAAEFNIWADPEAAQRVFASGLDVTMIGLDVTHQAIVTPAHADELRAPGGSARSSRSWSTSTRASTAASTPSSAARRCTTRSRSRTCSGRASSTCGRPTSRSTAAGARAAAGRTSTGAAAHDGRAPNAKVGLGIDADAFRALLFERIASLG